MELVRWRDEHFEHMLRWGADPRMTEYVGNGKPWSPEYVAQRHEQALRHWEEHGFGLHAVVEDGEVIGLAQMLDAPGEIEIGYWVAPEHWGRGVATEVAARLRDKALAFKDRVIAGHQAENAASGRVLEKIGLTYFTSRYLFGRLQHGYALDRGMSDTGVLRYSAFTTDPAGGNPAGVVLDATELTDDEMLAVAAKVGYSETAFLFPGKEDREFHVRYFSPEAEVPFCGHATIATSVALAERLGDGPLTFHTLAGEITVETSGGTATLTSVPTSTEEADPELVARALAALRYREIGDGPVHVGFGGARHLLIPVRSREQLARLDYDFDALRDLMLEHDLTTVHLFWRESPELVHARDPFPVGGVVEDAATGAAAAAFGGYLRDLEGPQRFVISQGEDMGRPSRLEVDATRADRRVTVTGAAVVIQPS
ncbi:PhzF family phenazine biosynthesis isomerase [Nocardia sp. NRRL S-836]|uniref:PhzF family phenazine biosynthesis isomerase n=1 Tax=Nocardia sp. NRRL S-836 TaxID=1519492 RepID=UPI0018D0AF86|nr:PhzF family phenazine biosynthesis isomerase [Nocardia sp. NRRL S-836]